MRRSTEKILTTHTGSLPWDKPLTGEEPDYQAQLDTAVGDVVRRQRNLGLDIINEGEYSKEGDWLSFMDGRLSGCEARPNQPSVFLKGHEQQEFADFYKYAAQSGRLFYMPSGQMQTSRNHWICTGPLAYQGQELLKREIEYVKKHAGTNDVFLTSTAPASIEPYYINEYYDSDEGLVFAMAEALHTEYKMITDSGLILQIDDAWLPSLWNMIGIEMGLEAFLKRSKVRVDALNKALEGLPEEQIRYHLCWGSWHGPHTHDLELKYLVDLMLEVKAGAYMIEAANARHEHEYAVWGETKLPDGKILIPGVITHSTDLVEHPELVAQRIKRFADRVGKENVIAGTDCGFGGRAHPQIAWAKLASLCEGARIATKTLW